ncbi:MAG TPA: hypothetical protein PKG81_05540, partial [Candidatus Omnitrophota bacterium]|nr:hypothetical protein [Candidatus Omnitrophota bacterium]
MMLMFVNGKMIFPVGGYHNKGIFSRTVSFVNKRRMKKTCFIFLITAMSLCFALQTSSFADDLKGTFLDLKVYLEQGTSEETTEDVGELTAHVIEKLDLIKDVKDLSADQKEYLRT